MNNRCLRCSDAVTDSRLKFHPACKRKIFGASRIEPYLDRSRTEIIEEVRLKALRMSLGGAQPKASLKNVKGKFEIVQTGGEFLIKPSTENHPFISENEHFCMNVARAFQLPVPEFCLISLKSGDYAFLIRRFDRVKKTKLHLEDFASVMNLPADDKYKASYYEVVTAAVRYCRDKGLERLRIFRQVVLSYVLGNNDLHLKNFSLLDSGSFYEMSPVYDIVCSALYYPQAPELAIDLIPEYEGGLAVEGYYTKKDFRDLGLKTGISERQADEIIGQLISFEPKIYTHLDQSFIPIEKKDQIKTIIRDKFTKFKMTR